VAEVRWTPQAADDLEAITEFIALDSAAYAAKFASDILETAAHLEEFPESGRVVPEIGQIQIRELLMGNYRIIYRVPSALVEILTIHHGARILRPDELG
jgi:toxin ParE1/3/4